MFVPGPSKEESSARQEKVPDLGRRLVLAAITLAVVATGLWVFWPSLHMGFHLDDYLHIGEVQGHDILPDIGPLELFTFAQPVPNRMGDVQGDFLPWWRAEDLLIDFFRPLACVTYYIDYALFGADPFWFHVTNMLWWSALLAIVVGFYAVFAKHDDRSLLTVLVAGLVFAIDRAHEGNVAWIAGRYSMVSVFCSVVTLLRYHRWRQSGGDAKEKRRLFGWTLLWLLLALGSSEASVGLAGFFFGYELSLGRGNLLQRVKAIAPMAAVMLGYIAFYSLAGHGVKSSDWYIDPLRSTNEFVEVGLQRNYLKLLIGLLLPEAITTEPLLALARSEGVTIERAAAIRWTLAGALVVLIVFTIHSAKDRVSRFLLIGSVICLVPQSAAPIPPRSLLFPTIGISYIYAALAADALRGLKHLIRPGLRMPWAFVRLAVVALLLWAHFRYDALLAQRAMEQRMAAARVMLARATAAEMPVGDELDGSRVLILTSPTVAESCYMPLIRLQQGLGWPGGAWAISGVDGLHRFTRTGDKTFRLELRPKGFLGDNWVGLFRDDRELPLGSRFDEGVLEITIDEVGPKGQVWALGCEIDLPLDDPKVWIVAWDGESWSRYPTPAVGESFDVLAPMASMR